MVLGGGVCGVSSLCHSYGTPSCTIVKHLGPAEQSPRALGDGAGNDGGSIKGGTDQIPCQLPAYLVLYCALRVSRAGFPRPNHRSIKNVRNIAGVGYKVITDVMQDPPHK